MLKYLLSEEIQTSLHRATSGTVLDKPELYEQFGADKMTDGRTFHFHNVYEKQANPPQFSPYDPESKFYAFLRDKFAEFLTTTEDTNTFLRKKKTSTAQSLMSSWRRNRESARSAVPAKVPWLDKKRRGDRSCVPAGASEASRHATP